MITWPPIMPNRSEDLKRCLTGNPECKNETLYRKLEELGYSRHVKWVRTDDLIEKVEKSQQGYGMSFKAYETKDKQIAAKFD